MILSNTKTWSTYQKHNNDTLWKNSLLLCCKQKQQEYNRLYDKMWAKHSNNTVTYYMNIIQNKYQGTNQQGSVFPNQAHIHNYIQMIFTTNHKQDSTHGDNKQKSVHIQWLQRGAVFVLLVNCSWYRLSWAWRTCAHSYCLSYFLFKIYMKNNYLNHESIVWTTRIWDIIVTWWWLHSVLWPVMLSISLAPRAHENSPTI